MGYFKKENDKINTELDLNRMWPDMGKTRPSAPTFWWGTPALLDSYPKESDPSGKPLNTPGAKADSGKLRPWLVLGAFSKALEEVSKVGTAGAIKYTPNGWKTVENAKERYMDAFGRHLLKFGKGEIMDDGPNGTNTHHIANMIWNLCAVLELELNDKSTS